jgi:hypothetical protein
MNRISNIALPTTINSRADGRAERVDSSYQHGACAAVTGNFFEAGGGVLGVPRRVVAPASSDLEQLNDATEDRRAGLTVNAEAVPLPVQPEGTNSEHGQGFTNTERSRAATLPAIGERDDAPEGPGTGGNKPLMGNRAANVVPPAIGSIAGNTFNGGRIPDAQSAIERPAEGKDGHPAPATALSGQRSEVRGQRSDLMASVSLNGWTEGEIAEATAKRELYEQWVGLQRGGVSGNQAAKELGEPHSKFCQWRQAIAREGFAGLLPKRRQCGAKPKFTTEGTEDTEEAVVLPQWFIPAARFFYLLSNRTKDRGSVPEALFLTVSLPNLPKGWTKGQTARFLRAINWDSSRGPAPICPDVLRETILARRREGTAMLPRRVMQAITSPSTTVRQHRNPTNAALDFLSAPGSAIWIQSDSGERVAIRDAGHVVESDDATINVPAVVPWPIGGCPVSDRWGVKLGRFQWLVSADVWSRKVCAYSYTARPRSSYRGEDIVSLMRMVARTHGIPENWRFERGAWESDIVKGAVRTMGSNLWTVYSPHQKPFIEGLFNALWTKLSVHFPDSDVGRFRGETEAANDLLVKCQRGSVDPRLHFPMLDTVLAVFDQVIAEKNATPVSDNYGGRWIPDERFAAREKFRAMDANTEWMFSPAVREATVRGCVVSFAVPVMEGPDGRVISVPFDFSAAGLMEFHGVRVRCYFDPHEPRCAGTIVLAQPHGSRRAGEVVCVAPQVNETTAAIRAALGYGTEGSTGGRTARQQAAAGLRREVRAVVLAHGHSGARPQESEFRDGNGGVTRIETGGERRLGAADVSQRDASHHDRAARRAELERFERENQELFV